MTDLSSLIKRLEEAEGPSRELDAHIRCTLLAPAESYVDQSKFNGEWLVYKMWADGRARLLEPHQFSVPHDLWRGHYTASIDAAIALAERVLPGCFYLIGKGKTRHDEPPFGAQIMFGTDEVLGEGESSASLSIALVLATLRALQSKGDTP